MSECVYMYAHIDMHVHVSIWYLSVCVHMCVACKNCCVEVHLGGLDLSRPLLLLM